MTASATAHKSRKHTAATDDLEPDIEVPPAEPPRYVHFCATCCAALGIAETPTAVRTVCDKCGNNTLTSQHLVTDELDAALAAS